MKDRFTNIQNDMHALIRKEALFHAYLFFGEDTAAIAGWVRRLAHALERGSFEDNAGFLNDALEIRPTERETIGIDAVRAAQTFLYQKPIISKRRMAVIWPAEALTDEAQSALLKIIEEPPQNALIVVIARAEDGVLSTIRSRMHPMYVPAGKETKEGEDFVSETLGILHKRLEKHAALAHELIRRNMAMERYNLNKPLQMRLLEGYAEQCGIAAKKKSAERRKNKTTK